MAWQEVFANPISYMTPNPREEGLNSKEHEQGILALELPEHAYAVPACLRLNELSKCRMNTCMLLLSGGISNQMEDPYILAQGIPLLRSA